MDTRIGDYTILSMIGSGGMGQVFLARQSHPVERRVALKLIRPGFITDEMQQRFNAERQALAVLSHPGIARILDAGQTDDGMPYFAMEYVPGVPITTYCDRQRLGLDARLLLFTRVCDAVQHAHQHGIIHRDLKPVNILVSDQEGAAVPKVIDFGIAKHTDIMAVDGVQTEAGCAPGTPKYMSPEQATPGRTSVDTRSDIYSLGALLHELVIGDPPLFQHDGEELDLVQFLGCLREEEPDRPSASLRARAEQAPDDARRIASARGADVSVLIRDIEGGIDWICLRALEKDRARRYQSSADLAADIKRHLQHEPLVAGPPGKTYRMARFIRRHRLAVSGGSVVVLLLMAGLIISLILYFKAEALNEGYRQLADLWMVEMLEGEETELWPALPRTAKRMKQWLAVEEQIAACLPSYQAALAGLPVQESDEFSHHESTGPRWKHRVFSELVARLKAMHAPDTGTRDSVRKRLLEARTVYSRTILEPAAGWTEAIESIADANRCPAYEGLRIVPQIGFIPVSRNAESGLWEFEHPYTGMVFVLIPGGRFLMGSCAPESRNPDFSKQEDPNHAPDEGPATEVALAPFLLSRYEMTQAQWLHFTGDNPSNYKDYRAYPDELKPTNPVENVSYEDCSAVLQKLDFVLPTEAQWEYACRAGTTCPYSFGAKESGIGRSGNIADISYWLETRSDRSNRLINDNHFFHAPVGSFQPNRFGLHDMHGNMMEWCRDWYFSYDEVKPRPGDGLREAPAGKPGRLRVFRGGSWMSPARDARSAVRFRQRPAFRHGSIGVRPARALDPEPPRMPEK